MTQLTDVRRKHIDQDTDNQACAPDTRLHFPQQVPTHPKGGWQQDEIDLLFSAVSEAAEKGRPLRDVFAEVGAQLSRKPNSIRNFYYARVRETPQLAARQAPFRSFTNEEVHQLLRHVLIGRGQGQSVRACVTQLADGDRTGMLRYQNKYRSILKNKPELLMEVAQELRMEGLPCPDNVAACRRYERAARPGDAAARLENHLSDPAVRGMVENLLSLLDRPAPFSAEGVVPYQKWADARREADQLKVEVDLLKMALEDARGMQDGE